MWLCSLAEDKRPLLVLLQKLHAIQSNTLRHYLQSNKTSYKPQRIVIALYRSILVL